ncbi:MAG: hypothetical protein ACK5NK_13740, partial [Niabella sp.]
GISIKWIPANDTWYLGGSYFIKANSQNLNTKEYYTEFKHAFDFKTVKTDKLTFKINFQIK